MFVTIRQRLAQVAQFFELVDGLVDTQRFTRGSSSRRATPSSSPVMKRAVRVTGRLLKRRRSSAPDLPGPGFLSLRDVDPGVVRPGDATAFHLRKRGMNVGPL
jgi:hypothetical protein